MILKKEKLGFTLIEILVAMSITVILMLVVNNFIITGFRTNTFNSEQETAIEHARDASNDMSHEIRGANSSEKGDYALSTVSANNFVFYNDVDKDNKREKVRYFLDGRYLKRVVTEPGTNNNYTGSGVTSTLANYMNNVTEPVFRYYDSDNVETSIVNNIRLIRLNLKINVTPTRAPADYYVQLDVELRNLKDDL